MPHKVGFLGEHLIKFSNQELRFLKVKYFQFYWISMSYAQGFLEDLRKIRKITDINATYKSSSKDLDNLKKYTSEIDLEDSIDAHELWVGFTPDKHELKIPNSIVLHYDVDDITLTYIEMENERKYEVLLQLFPKKQVDGDINPPSPEIIRLLKRHGFATDNL